MLVVNAQVRARLKLHHLSEIYRRVMSVPADLISRAVQLITRMPDWACLLWMRGKLIDAARARGEASCGMSWENQDDGTVQVWGEVGQDPVDSSTVP